MRCVPPAVSAGHQDERHRPSDHRPRRTPLGDDDPAQLPREPWSFAGQYISIIWAIEVNVDVPMGRDLSYRERLVMRPKAAR